MLGLFRRGRSSTVSIIESAQNNDVQHVKQVVKQTKRRSLTDTDSEGRTALHVAALQGHGGMVEILLNLRGDANKRDKNGRTPLHDACSGDNPQSIDITRTLLAVGSAQATALANDGSSALHFFVRKNPRDVDQFADTITLMIKEGLDINSQTNIGETVLHIAASQGNISLVDFFLSQGAEIDRRTKDGETPLHMALRFEYLDVAKLLLDRGANTSAQSNFGTVMEYCVRCQSEGAQELMQEASYAQQAKLMRERKDKETNDSSLQIDLEIVNNFKNKGYDTSAIIAAIYTLHTSSMPTDNEQMILNELENGNQSMEKECLHCMENDIDCILYPCGHATLCMDCANLLLGGECSCCKIPVEKVVKIFHK